MHSYEVKRYSIIYWCTVVVVGIGLGFLLQFVIDRLDRAYIAELLRMVNDQEGLKETGYLTYMPSDYNVAVREAIASLYGLMYGCLILISIFGYIMGLFLYKLPIRALKDVGMRTKVLLENDTEEAFSFDVYEGDIGQFYSIYGKVVMAIRQSREDERKEKMFLQDLIADISHQLKTPLATLTIYQDLLDNPDLPDEQRTTMLKAMGEQLTRMEWLVLSLLKLARLEAGSILFDKQELPMLSTLELAANNVKTLSDAKGQNITISCDKDMVVNHDPEWLAEAITNILKNATEYAPQNSTIEVWAEQSPVTTMIYIKDYGIGISPEDCHKVFKRFYRAKSKVNENSIGIGLALSKSIVEGQGGDIAVESEPGSYTCFVITLYRFVE